MTNNPIITSMLDDDLYKFSMAQAVIQKFPKALASYSFINRGQHKFSEDFVSKLLNQINLLSELSLKLDEREYLEKKCPYFTPPFLDWLTGYHYNPNEVSVTLLPDSSLNLTITGPWYRTILWEVKLMSIISELKMKESSEIYESNFDKCVSNTLEKFRLLNSYGISISDFGTRRRFSEQHHSLILETILNSPYNKKLQYTSNLKFAKLYALNPVGTQAHEWFMVHSAIYGYQLANEMAMEKWLDVYQGQLGIALTDTFTSKDFFRSFNTKLAKAYDGLRHDSGSPTQFFTDAFDHYKKLGINPKSKTLVFSDSLNVDKIININRTVEPWMNCSFGVGTNLTNDVPDVTPMNMVIKLSKFSPNGTTWFPVIKLSDDPGKHTGIPEEIENCKKSLNIK